MCADNPAAAGLFVDALLRALHDKKQEPRHDLRGSSQPPTWERAAVEAPRAAGPVPFAKMAVLLAATATEENGLQD